MEEKIKKSKVSELVELADITNNSYILVSDSGVSYKYPASELGGGGSSVIDSISVNGVEQPIVNKNVDIDAQPYNEDTVIDANYVHTDNNLTDGLVTKIGTIQNKQNSTDMLLETENTNIVDAINEVNSIAKQASNGRSFDTLTALNDWLAIPANVALLKVGDAFYIVALDTPDYWWDGTQKQELETQKVNLSQYYTETEIDNLLLAIEPPATQITENNYGNVQLAIDTLKLATENVSADGSYPLTNITGTGAINLSLTPNRVFDIQKKLTGTLTLSIDSTGRKDTTTNDYMVQFDMGSLQTVVHPANVRWAEGVLPYISASKMFFCTYTEKIIWTTNLFASSGSAIAGSNWNSQRYTMSWTPSGASILTALQAISTVTFYKATPNVTANLAFFTASMVGLHLYIGSTYAGQIQSIASPTVAVVSGTGNIASAGSPLAGSIGGYISSSSTARQEFTFHPTISGAYLTASTPFIVTATAGSNIQFEAREFASPYLATNVETAQTIYIGNIETI